MTAPVVQPADQPAPDTTAGDALREAIAAALDDTATGLFMGQSGPGWGDTVARILLGVPEVQQLLADAAELRAKVQRVEGLIAEEVEFREQCPGGEITVKVPEEAGREMYERIFDAVADAAYEAQPKDRGDWDVFVSGNTKPGDVQLHALIRAINGEKS